jgi:WD40 repeat protein/predicted transcriptional regulator
MRFPANILKEGNNCLLLVTLITMILFAGALLNIPNRVSAEDNEPVLNFYVERELVGHSDDITSLAWSSNGLWIASGSLDNSTKIWSTSTWNVLRTFNHPAPVNELSWSKNTQRLALSYGNGTIHIYNSVGWNLIQNLSQHVEDVNALDWNPTGSALSSGDKTGTIEIWDTSSWNSIETLGMLGGISDLKWSNDGTKLAACSDEGTIRVWDTTTWLELRSFDVTSGNEATESIAWNPTDSELASSSGDNKVIVWDTLIWNSIQNKDVESPKEIEWGSDGSYITVGASGGIKTWDTSTWNELQTNGTQGTFQVNAVSMNPDGNKLVSGSPSDVGNKILIWEKNLSPVLDLIGNLNILEDESFSYTVTAADDDPLIFSDDSDLFDVDSDSGQISFTPTNDDVGEHTITVTVTDRKGGIDSEIFLLTVVNVDDPPVPVLKWHYGADYVNIDLRVGGQMGNSVKLSIEEDGIGTDELIVEKESEDLGVGTAHIVMNSSKTYNAYLNYSGISGENPVAITFEWDDIAFTKHLLFDSELGNEQVVNLYMEDFFHAMGLIVFDGADSVDVDNEIIMYFWDFDHGDYEGDQVVHSYLENGKYNVRLTVESDNGINRSVSTELSLDQIIDTEDLKSQIVSDLTLEYLESTNQNAVLINSRNHLRIVDSRGKTTGYEDGSHKFEIEGIDLIYSNNISEVYYFPNDMKLSFNIDDSEKAYDLDVIIRNQGSTRIISVYGRGKEVTLELDDEEGNSFIILTSEMENEYSLKIEADGVTAREIFSLTDINISNQKKHHYFINNWEGLTTDDKAVTLGIDEESDGKIDLFIDLEDGMTGEGIEVVIMKMGKSDSPFFTTSSILLIVGFVGIAGIGGFIGATEIGKLALLSLILPLYSRIKKEQVLDNEIRGMIRGYIIANPGDNYNSIKRALNLNNGTLAYHLRVLEKAKAIQSKQDGIYKRFYPSGMKIPEENGGEISEIQKILLHKIAESPGISQKEIATMLGLSKGVINYHVKVLNGKQLIQMEKRGRKTRCYVNLKKYKE